MRAKRMRNRPSTRTQPVTCGASVAPAGGNEGGRRSTAERKRSQAKAKPSGSSPKCRCCSPGPRAWPRSNHVYVEPCKSSTLPMCSYEPRGPSRSCPARMETPSCCNCPKTHLADLAPCPCCNYGPRGPSRSNPVRMQTPLCCDPSTSHPANLEPCLCCNYGPRAWSRSSPVRKQTPLCCDPSMLQLRVARGLSL